MDVELEHGISDLQTNATNDNEMITGTFERAIQHKDIATGASARISFTADKRGPFMYYCTYHPKTMSGTMLVLP